MNINQLIYFVDIAQTKSITKTAEKYFISQQAVSEAIKKLEGEFHVKLTQRIRKGVELTEAGLYFLHNAEKIIELYTDMQNKFNEQADTAHFFLAGNLNVAVHPRCFHLGFSDFLSVFVSKYPRITLNIIESNINQCVELVKSEPETLSILIAPNDFLSSCQEEVIYLGAHRSFVCYGKKHPLYHQNVLYNMDLFTAYSVATFAADHIALNTTTSHKCFFCNDLQTQIALIEQGNAIGCFTEYEVDKYFAHHKQIICKELERDQISHLALLYSSSHSDSAVHQVFRDEVQRYFLQDVQTD